MIHPASRMKSFGSGPGAGVNVERNGRIVRVTLRGHIRPSTIHPRGRYTDRIILLWDAGHAVCRFGLVLQSTERDLLEMNLRRMHLKMPFFPPRILASAPRDGAGLPGSRGHCRETRAPSRLATRVQPSWRLFPHGINENPTPDRY